MGTHTITPLDEARAALAAVRSQSSSLVSYVKQLRETRDAIDGKIDEAISLLSAMGYDEHGQPVKK